MRKILLKIAGVIILILLLFPFMLILVGRNQLHDSDIPQKGNLTDSASKLRIMAFFPHPDDEVTVSGTLMKLIDQGHEVYLVCLTKGEAGNSGELFSKEEFAVSLSLQNPFLDLFQKIWSGIFSRSEMKKATFSGGFF